jgi:hypothetical protein
MTYRLVRTRPRQDALPLVFGGLAELVKAARENGPRRYNVDEFAAAGEALPSGHTVRQWGVITHQANGHIISEPLPWPRHAEARSDP